MVWDEAVQALGLVDPFLDQSLDHYPVSHSPALALALAHYCHQVQVQDQDLPVDQAVSPDSAHRIHPSLEIFHSPMLAAVL